MTARGYELDEAVRRLQAAVAKLDLKQARVKAATGVTFDDTGGYFGGGTITLQDLLDLVGSGAAPTGFLRSTLGEVHTIDTSHPTLTGTATFDLANGNVHPGTLTGNVTISTVGWTSGKGCYIRVSLTGDGASTPTISGVTWIGSAPGVIGAGDVLHLTLFSDDGGTVIYGAVVGGGSTSSGGQSPTELLAGEIFTVPDRRQALWSDSIIFGVGSGISIGSGSAFIEVH